MKTNIKLIKYNDIWYNLSLNRLNNLTNINNKIPPNSKECYRIQLKNIIDL